MLETLGEVEAAKAVEDAVKEVTGTKIKSLSAGKMGYSTSEVGDYGLPVAGTVFIHTARSRPGKMGIGAVVTGNHRFP